MSVRAVATHPPRGTVGARRRRYSRTPPGPLIVYLHATASTHDRAEHGHASHHAIGLTDQFALRAAAWLFCVSGIEGLLAFAVPKRGGTPSWMEVSASLVFLACGAALLAAPGVMRRFLPITPLAGVAGVSWFAWSGEPAMGSYAFYLLIVAFSGLFLSRLNLIVAFAASAASLGVAVVIADGGHLRVQLWGTVVVVTASCAFLVRMLRERLDSVRADLARGATRDALTGLLNRHGIAAAPVAAGDVTSVVTFDLDHFKQLNDTHGHGVGDLSLASFAGVLSGHARHEDVVGRIGGEEFIAILPGCGASQAAAFAERVRRAVAEEVDRPAAYTVSVGVATGPTGAGIEAIQREADRALYRAKDAGRDRVVTSDSVPRSARVGADVPPAGQPELSWASLARVAWRAAVTGAPRPGVSDTSARRAAGVLYAVGAVVCALITTTMPLIHGHPDGLLWLALAMGVFGVAMLAIPRLDPVAKFVPYIGVVTVAAAVAMADPYTGTVMYFAWPLLFTAYFFAARVVFVSLGLAAVGLAVGLWLDVEHVAPVVMWMNTMVALTLITLLTLFVQLHIERVHAILGDLATTDALTELPNRRAFYERAGDAVSTGPFATVLFDIDHFKRINDRDGHDAGDAVLRIFADALRGGARTGDLIARHGGEEFAAVLRGADVRSARAFAERVRAAFHDDALRMGWDVTVSAGVTVDDGCSADEPEAHIVAAVGRADAAMYAAKRGGRDAVSVWDDDGDAEAR